MHDLLLALGKTRSTREWIETEIKRLEGPHIEAAKAASKNLRVALAAAKDLDEKASTAARTAYLQRTAARRDELLAGVEAPGIDIPEGWTVQLRAALEIQDAAAVPRELCSPDTKAVAAALKAGSSVPGATLIENPVFVRRSSK